MMADLKFKELVKEVISIKDDEKGHMDRRAFEKWGTKTLNLIENCFSKESVYYRNFQRNYERASQSSGIKFLDSCLGSFTAAREAYKTKKK